MSKLRLIPKLQLKPASYNPKKLVLVVTRGFNEVIEIGDPVSQSKIFQDQLADELIFVNINPTNASEIDILAKVINSVSQEIFMPLTVGGGVTTIEDFRTLLSNGADKVSIKRCAARQGPSVWELDGPTPILNISNTEMASWLK